MTSMPGSKQPKNVCTTFLLCGISCYKGATMDFTPLPEATLSLERALSDHFNLDGGVQILLHGLGESCEIVRPVSDLTEELRPEDVDGKKYEIHLQRVESEVDDGNAVNVYATVFGKVKPKRKRNELMLFEHINVGEGEDVVGQDGGTTHNPPTNSRSVGARSPQRTLGTAVADETSAPASGTSIIVQSTTRSPQRQTTSRSETEALNALVGRLRPVNLAEAEVAHGGPAAQPKMDAEDDQSVSIRVLFKTADSALCLRDLKGFAFDVPARTKADDLPDVCKDMILQGFATDSDISRTLWDKSRTLICELIPHFDGDEDYQKQFYLYFSGGKTYVPTLADLFDGLSAPTTILTLQCKLSLEAAPTKHDSLDRATVMLRDDPGRYLRLGSIDDRTDNQLPSKDDVRTDVAAVGWSGDDDFFLFRVPSFHINGLWIAAVHDGVPGGLTSSWAWQDDFKGLNALSKIGKRAITILAGKDAEETGKDLPTPPQYTFRRYDASEHSLGLAEWPHGGISIVVHCVNKIPRKQNETAITFPDPKDFQFRIQKNGTPDTIRAHVLKELRLGEKKYKCTSEKLFRPGFMPKWEMRLWALPQIERSTLMYQYREGQLTQFLTPEGSDRRVYVEAHVVPVKPRR